jgi:hydrogenase nickel incorporation protein HypA/HybF
MHEMSIALQLLDVLHEEAQRRAVRAVAVHVRVGPLSGVVPEAMRSAFELAREGGPYANTALVLETVPLVVRCEACAEDVILEGPVMLACPRCGLPTPGVVGGRELEIVALEIEP